MRRLFSNLCFLRSLKSLLLFFSFMVFAQDMHLPSTQIKTVQPSGLSFSFTTSQPTSLALPSMTTSTRGNFSSPFEGQFIYNSTAHQPEFWNGSAWTPSAGSSVLTTLGDILYENATPANTRLPGNTTATKKYLSQTGTGSVSAAPSWLQPACGDLSNAAASCSTDTTNAANIGSGTLPAARLPNPSASTLGGVESALAVTHQWINSISTSGVPALSQPAFTDISGVCTIAQGCTNNGSLGVTAGGVLYTDGSKVVNVGAGTTGQALKSNGSSAPTWGAVAGSGVKNYLSTYIASTSSGVANTGNGDFELNATTGWTLGTTGTLTNGLPTGSPTFGSGASGNLSINITNGGLQIAGTASLTYSQSVSATVAGNMVASNAFFIDKEDQGNILTYSLKYFAATSPGNANWSGTSSSSFGVAVWDVTNSIWLGVSNPFGFIQSSGVGSVNGSFAVPTNTTQLRFVVYNANATSGTITVFFDDSTVGPATPATVNGQLVASRAHVGTGASTAGGVQFNFDVVDFDYSGSITTGVGSWKYAVPYTGSYLVCVNYYYGAGGVNSAIYLKGSLYAIVQNNDNDPGNGCSLVPASAGDSIDFRPNTTATPTATGTGTTGQNNYISIFMVGGSSGSAIPNPTIAASAYLSANAAASATVPVKFDTKLYDTCNCYSTSTGQFTAPVSGLYQIGGFINPPSSIDINVYKNNIFYINYGWNTSTFFSVGTMDLQLNANDTIDIRPSGSVTFGGSAPSPTAGTPTSTVTFKLIQSVTAKTPTTNVSSSSFGFERVERANIASNGAITSQSGNWLSGSCVVTDTSYYTCPMTAGYWSSMPACNTTINTTDGTVLVGNIVSASTTTSLQVRFYTLAVAKQAVPFMITCMGPR